MELVLSLYYCPVMSKAEQMKQANFVKTFLTQANRIAEASFHTVSGQLAPRTIRLGRLAPEFTNLTMFLLFVFYRGFLRTIQYYMFQLFTSYKRFSAVLKLKCYIEE